MKQLVLVAAFVIGVTTPALAQETTAPAQGIDPASMDCAYTFGSGDFVWCVGAHGNLRNLKSPSGVDHVWYEGYGLCLTGAATSYNDWGLSEAGWAAPSPPTVGANSVTIVRSTTDGRFTLTQKWTRDTKERDVTLLMTLKNNGPVAANVRLLRQLTLSVDGTNANDYSDESAHAVWSRDIRSVAATQLNFNDTHDNWIGYFYLADCAPLVLGTGPTGPGQASAVLQTTWATIPAGGNKKVTVVYRVH